MTQPDRSPQADPAACARMAQDFVPGNRNAPPRAWLDRHGVAILTICGTLLLAIAAISVADKAIGQAAYDAVHHEALK